MHVQEFRRTGGFAYNAALKLCTILLYAEGYKAERNLQHYRTIQTLFSHFLSLPDYIDALRQRPALNDFLSIFQMRPLFSESETRWPLQFARDDIWMYGGCFLGC